MKKRDTGRKPIAITTMDGVVKEYHSLDEWAKDASARLKQHQREQAKTRKKVAKS